MERLGGQIKNHNIAIESLSPSRKAEKTIFSSELKKALLFENSFSPDDSGIYLKKRLQDQEREISYLKNDLISFIIQKEQNANLHQQLKFMRDKLSHYENELSEKTLLLSQQDTRKASEEQGGIISNLKEKLKQQEKNINELRTQLSHVTSKYEESEFHRQNLKKKCIELDQELRTKREETEYEREQTVAALEEDNEKLRDELAKSMDSLQKCQVEISYIPQLRKELHMSETCLGTLSKELENEKTIRGELQTEKENTDSLLRNLNRVTRGRDPVEFIEELQEQLNKTNFELMSIGDQVSVLETKQKRHDAETINNTEDIKDFLEKLIGFTETDFYSEGVPVFPRLDNELAEKFHEFYLSFSKRHREALAYFAEMNNIHNELSVKATHYEELTDKLMAKQDQINHHMSGQESMYHKLQGENQILERKLKNSCRELEKHYNILQKFDGVLATYNSEYDTSSLETIQILLEKQGKTLDKLTKLRYCYKELQGKHDHLETSYENQADQFKKCSRQYASKIEYLKEDIDQMTTVISNNERNLKEMVDSYNSLIVQYKQLHGQYEQLKETHKTVHQPKINECLFLTELAKVFFPLLKQRNDLITQKRYCLDALNSYEEQFYYMKDKLALVNKPSPRTHLSKFRSVTMVIICTVKLRKHTGRYEKRTNIDLLSVKSAISLPNLSSCTQNTFLEKLFKKNPDHMNHPIESISLSSPRFIELFDNSYLKLVSQIKRKSKNIDELSKQLSFDKNRNRNLKEEIRDQQAELQSFKQHTTDLLSKIEDSSATKNTFSQRRHSEIEGYKKLIKELQETSVQLKNGVEMIRTERNEYKHDNDEKTKQIEYLEIIIDNLRTCIAKSSRDTPDSIQSEIINLSDLLRKFMVGYTSLEKKLEQNRVYAEEMIDELKKKNRTITLLEKKLIHYKESLTRVSSKNRCKEACISSQ